MKLLYIVSLVGTGVFAVSGALTAMRKNFDLLGVMVIAEVTAMGGGTLRDLLLFHRPIFWIGDPAYVLVIVLAACLTILYVRYRRPPVKALLYADAVGLALFTLSGARIAEADGVSGIVVVLMGAITGSAGGLIRDVLCAQVPLLLRKGELYTTTSIVGVVVYLFLQSHGVGRPGAALVGMAVVLGLRLAAIFWGITLPVFALSED